MKVLAVNSNLINAGSIRLDAEYHLSNGFVTKAQINKSPFPINTLAEVTEKLYNGPRFKRCYVTKIDKGISFMGSSDMMYSNLNDLKLISKKLSKNLKSLFIEKNWTLVSCSGTIGNTVYTNEDFLNKTASQHILRVVPNEQKIYPGYLYAYLATKQGYSLLTQGTYGAVIQHIEPAHIQDLPIPIFPKAFQENIHSLISRAADLRFKANSTLQCVINEIDGWIEVSGDEMCYSISADQIFKGDKYTDEKRLEADYYSPNLRVLVETIKNNHNWSYLGDVCKAVYRSGLRERKFVRSGIPLITGQHLGLNKLSDLKFLSKKFTKNIDKNITQNHDIIISVQGTLGRLEFVWNNFYKGTFASEQTARISANPERINPGYLYAYLSSKIGQKLILKYKTGSVVEWIRENNICSIPVIVPKDKGEVLGKKIYDLFEQRQKAYELESEAITSIEKEIESWQK